MRPPTDDTIVRGKVHSTSLQSIQAAPARVTCSFPLLYPQQTGEDLYDLVLVAVTFEKNVTLEIRGDMHEQLEKFCRLCDRCDMLQLITEGNVELRVPDSREFHSHDTFVGDEQSPLALISFDIGQNDDSCEVQNFAGKHSTHDPGILLRGQVDPRNWICAETGPV